MLDTLETGEIARRIRRLVRDRARGRPRCRCRAGAALGRSHHAAGGSGAGAGAWRADHLGHPARQRRAMPTIIGKRGSAHRRAASGRSRRGAPASARRSAMKIRRASSSSRTCRGAIPMRWRRRTANCSWPRAAARWACSPRCAPARRRKPHRRSRWPMPGLRSTPSMSTGSTPARWSICSAPRKMPACSAPMRCATASTCRGARLRLVVFDKVPWPKPTILHKARRAQFGKGYDDLITRFRLKQAFGRLIRGPEDKGCFVILEGATPARLLAAFPEEAPVKRCGLAEAIGDIRAFLGPEAVTHAAHPPYNRVMAATLETLHPRRRRELWPVFHRHPAQPCAEAADLRPGPRDPGQRAFRQGPDPAGQHRSAAGAGGLAGARELPARTARHGGRQARDRLHA